MDFNHIKSKLRGDKHLVELIKKSSISLFLRVMGMLLGYISMLYITNIYGAKEFGTLMLILTIVAVFSLIPKFGMENALVRILGELYTLAKHKEIHSVMLKVLKFTFFMSVAFSMIMYLLSDYISLNILGKAYLSNYIGIASIAVVSTTLITCVAATFQGMKKIKEFMVIKIILAQLLFLIFLCRQQFYLLAYTKRF